MAEHVVCFYNVVPTDMDTRVPSTCREMHLGKLLNKDRERKRQREMCYFHKLRRNTINYVNG